MITKAGEQTLNVLIALHSIYFHVLPVCFLSFLHFGVFFLLLLLLLWKAVALWGFWLHIDTDSMNEPFSLLCPLWLRLVKCRVFVLQRGRLWFANENSYMCPGLPFCCKLAAHCWRAAGTCNVKSFHVMNSLNLSSVRRRGLKSGTPVSCPTVVLRNSGKRYYLTANAFVVHAIFI